ncbi:cytochrome P450 [Trametes cingulata]|nr:cytochrome P450 [Trametes cingulata]
MLSSLPRWELLALLVVVLVVVKVHNATKKRRKLPPGPRRLPLIGNLHQFPPAHPYKTFAKWGETYGDIVYVQLLRNSTIVLNYIEAARDLLDKRSSKYSDRPSMILHSEMIGQEAALVSIPYGDRFRKHRKWLYDGVGNKEKLMSYQDLRYREVRRLLRNLLDSPEKFRDHIHLYFAAMMLEITYGRRVSGLEDHLVQAGEHAINGAVSLGGPGAQLVDLGFPFLKHIPSWFPGAQFKRDALEVRQHVQHFKDLGYNAVLADLGSGNAQPCVYTAVLAEYAGSPPPEVLDDVKGLAPFNVYGAGVETSRGTLTVFFLQMVRHPEICRKAQEEIDRVVGKGRLPDYSDRDSLPYLNAVLEEVYRWGPVLPLAVPHRATTDDEYRGYDIPAGCTVIANTWAMTRDRRYFKDPEEFLPERYLVSDEESNELLLPSSFIFGFGRRVCPGQALADPSIWLAMANVLAVFDIKKPVDDAGHEFTPSAEFLSGFTKYVHVQLFVYSGTDAIPLSVANPHHSVAASCRGRRRQPPWLLDWMVELCFPPFLSKPCQVDARRHMSLTLFDILGVLRSWQVRPHQDTSVVFSPTVCSASIALSVRSSDAGRCTGPARESTNDGSRAEADLSAK